MRYLLFLSLPFALAAQSAESDQRVTQALISEIQQLRLAIEAVFKSWNGKRARDYRRQNKISDDLGTATSFT